MEIMELLKEAEKSAVSNQEVRDMTKNCPNLKGGRQGDVYIVRCDKDSDIKKLEKIISKNKNPIKKRAIYLIRQAIKNGNIKRQLECSVCGSSKLVSGHHDDYSKPLVVRWLCYLCHKKWHKENGSGLNG